MAGWLRLYTDIKNDRKLRRLPPGQRWLWVVMMALAKESPRPGWLLLSEGVPVTIDDLSDEAAITADEVTGGIEMFIKQNMLEEVDGVYHLINWDKRQFASDNSTERTKRYRQRKNETSQERHSDVTVTPPEYRVQSTEYRDLKDLFGESGVSDDTEPPPDESDDTNFNFPQEYWDKVRQIDTLPENKQLDMLVVEYGKKYPAQRKKFGTGGVVKARESFKKALDLDIPASDILKEILFDTPDEGEKEPAPWDITGFLIRNRGLEQTRAQMNYEIARQLEVIPHEQRNPP